ncbi:uncharacterized protein PFLUO_LOCUS2461 [Penicillium psychrofluorescens]|uniref:uncharacterized protein n=1 Tax=Penicillium psychrofluorescens TaxID=3158075 RepID=UPI003CCCD816
MVLNHSSEYAANEQPSDPVAEDPAGQLAEWITNTTYEDIPPEVVELAKQAIFDTLAVVIAGSAWEVSPQIVEQVTEWGGAPQSPILIYGNKVPAPAAAFANGVMARGIDMGDVHEKGGHVTEWNIPTMLAALGLADKPVSGREFLTAYLTGSEFSIRASASANISPHSAYGVPGEFYGSLCSAASVSRLLGRTTEETWNALGICYSVHSLSETQKYAEGTQMARVQHSFAGETAIKAVVLTRRGVTGPKGIFLGKPGGILRHIHWSGVDPSILTDGLGTKWYYAEGLSMKPYSSCKFTHSFIAGTIEVMAKHAIDYRDIAGITCIGSEGSRMTTEPSSVKWNPQTTPECVFSAPYTIATAAIRGTVFLSDFEDSEKLRPDKRELMKNIVITHDSSISDFEGFSVEILLKSGKRFRQVAPYVKGHTHNRMSWDDLVQKFWKCVPYSATPLPNTKLCRLIELCKNLEKVADVRELVEVLTP